MSAPCKLSVGAVAVAAFVAVLAGVPLAAPPFWVTLGNYIGLYSMVALGLVLLTGVAGLTSFGQAATGEVAIGGRVLRPYPNGLILRNPDVSLITPRAALQYPQQQLNYGK